MEQVQDGLTTMNEIIKGTKEQNQVNLSHQTTVMGEQIGSQNQTLSEMRPEIKIFLLYIAVLCCNMQILNTKIRLT